MTCLRHNSQHRPVTVLIRAQEDQGHHDQFMVLQEQTGTEVFLITCPTFGVQYQTGENQTFHITLYQSICGVYERVGS